MSGVWNGNNIGTRTALKDILLAPKKIPSVCIKSLDWCINNLQDDLSMLLSLSTYGVAILVVMSAWMIKCFYEDFLDFIPRFIKTL